MPPVRAVDPDADDQPGCRGAGGDRRAASGTVGSAFSYQISATNTPTSYGATGLPSGLTVNTTRGLISGTPAAAGTSTVNLSASNSAGTGNGTLTLTINRCRGAGGDRRCGERDGRERLLVSDFGDEYADQLRSDGIAIRPDGEQHDGDDLGNACGGGNVDSRA